MKDRFEIRKLRTASKDLNDAEVGEYVPCENVALPENVGVVELPHHDDEVIKFDVYEKFPSGGKHRKMFRRRTLRIEVDVWERVR